MGTEAANARISQEMFNSAIDFKLVWEKEFARCRSLGIDLPDPVPHPDDVILHRDGTVELKGLMTKEEKAKWAEFRKIKAMCDELPTMYTELDEETDPEERRTMRKDIAEVEKIRDMLGEVVRD